MSDIAVGDTVRINQNCTCEEWVGLIGTVASVTDERVVVKIDGMPDVYHGALDLKRDRFDLVEAAVGDPVKPSCPMKPDENGLFLCAMNDEDGRRGLWIRFPENPNLDPDTQYPTAVEIRAGREGSDYGVVIGVGDTITEKNLRQLFLCLMSGASQCRDFVEDPETGGLYASGCTPTDRLAEEKRITDLEEERDKATAERDKIRLETDKVSIEHREMELGLIGLCESFLAAYKKLSDAKQVSR